MRTPTFPRPVSPRSRFRAPVVYPDTFPPAALFHTPVPFLPSSSSSSSSSSPATLMIDQTKLDKLLNGIHAGTYRLPRYSLPKGITPGQSPEAEKLYHMTQAVRDVAGGTPVPQAIVQIPEYQRAVLERAVPVDTLLQASKLIASFERRELGKNALFSSLRKLMKLSSPAMAEDMIRLVEEAKPAIGSGTSTAIHSDKNVGLKGFDSESNESTLLHGYSGHRSAQRLMGTSTGEADMTRINLIVGAARNVLNSAESLTENHWKYRGDPRDLRDLSPAQIIAHRAANPSQWVYSSRTGDVPSIDTLLKAVAFSSQNARERKAARGLPTDEANRVGPMGDDERSRVVSPDRGDDSSYYRGADEERLRKNIEAMLGSSLFQSQPKIMDLLASTYDDPRMRPVLRRIAAMSGNPSLLTGKQEEVIRTLVSKRDQVAREDLLEKAATIVSSGHLSRSSLQTIRSAATSIGYTKLVGFIDAYGDPAGFQHSSDTQGVPLSAADYTYIELHHPREAKLLSSLLGGGTSSPNLNDPQVQARVAQLPYALGSVLRTIKAADQAQKMGVPLAQSQFSPFTTEMRALAWKLEEGGVLDPMAVHTSVQAAMLGVSPDMSHARLPEIAGVRSSKGGRLKALAIPHLDQRRLFEGMLSPEELAPYFQSEGAGVGLEGYERRLKDLLQHHAQGQRASLPYGQAVPAGVDPLAAHQVRLSDAQVEHYQGELAQVQRLRGTLHDPSFQLQAGHYLNIVHRAATGKGAIDYSIPADSDEEHPYTRFLAPLNNQFREGARTLGSIEELVDALQGGISRLQGFGGIESSEVDRVMAALGHDPASNEFVLGKPRSLLPAGKTYHAARLARQFPEEEANLLAQFTRSPFQEGQTVAFMGGMPGFTDETRGTRGAGLIPGTVGTLHPIQAGINFGLTQNYGAFWEHAMFTQEEYGRYKDRLHKGNPWLQKPAEPMAMLHTRDGERAPVRLSQVSDLQAKGLFSSSQAQLDRARLRHDLYTSGSIEQRRSRRQGTDADMANRLAAWRTTPQGKRYLRARRRENLPALPPQRPSQNQLQRWNSQRPAASGLTRGGANATEGRRAVANARAGRQSFLPPGSLGGSLGAASPFRQGAWGRQVPPALPPGWKASHSPQAQVPPWAPKGPLPPVNPQQLAGGGGWKDDEAFWQGMHARMREIKRQRAGAALPPPGGPTIAPDSRGIPPMQAPTPMGQLASLRGWLTSGSPGGEIHPPTSEQLAFMQDPARRTVLEGGPGTGKTATAVRRVMHGVASGEILPKNVLALSALRSAAARLTSEFGTYQKMLPQGSEYRFPDPRTFSSVAASTVLQAWPDENGKPFFPMLQKLGYGHLTGDILSEPTSEELYGKDPQVVMRMKGTGQKAFIAEHVNQYLTAQGHKPYSEQQVSDLSTYISEVKKSRGSPTSTYPHEMASGQQALAAGTMSQPAALALYEQGLSKRGMIDWDDLLSIAVEAYQKFGADALPDIFKGIEAVLIDEGQDVTPLVGTLQKEFFRALSANNPQVTVAMDVMQSLTQGMGGIPIGNIRGSYRDILGMAPQAPFHQLTQNMRSNANIAAMHNALLQSPHLANSPRSSLQTARSGNIGEPVRYITTKTQPQQYQQMFRQMLSRTGVTLPQLRQNVSQGVHPLTGASVRPNQVAAILPRNQDVDVFEHVARQDLQQALGVGPQEASTVLRQMMRQGMPSPAARPGDKEYDEAQMQMPLLKFMGARGQEFQYPHVDASFVGMWQRQNDVEGHLRNMNVGITRTSAGGGLTVGASQYPFTRNEAQRYLRGNLDLSNPDVMDRLTKRSRKNEFEQGYPRFFRDLSEGARTQLQQWGHNPDAGKVVDSNLVVNAKNVKMNVPPGGTVSINTPGAPSPGGPPPTLPLTPPGGQSPTMVFAPQGTPFQGAGIPPQRGGPLVAGGARNPGSGPGPSGGQGPININATGGGGSSGQGGGGGGSGSYTNAYSQFGRSMARLGFELQFLGKYFGQIVDSALQQGSEYRQATVPLPGSGSGAMAGTSGFYDFGNLGGGISAYQRNTLPMYSITQIAQGIRSLSATTGYRGASPPLGATTDLMGLAAITGMDPSQLMGSMAYLSGSSGQGQHMGTYGQMGGMLTNLFGNVLSQENVGPTLQAASSIVPTLQGLSPMGGSQTGQAMAFFELAQNAGMTPQNFGDVSSLLGSLSGVGSSPNLQQQYTLQRLGFPLTADTQLAQYQQEQTSRNMQMAQYGLMQNINEGVPGVFGGRSTGSSLSLPQLQIRIDQAQIQMDQANLVMSGLQLQQAQTSLQGSELQYQYGKASYGFNLAMNNALYGPIGKDYSRLAGYSFQQNQLVAQRSYTSPEVGVMFSPQNVSGLRNQEFYAGLQNQQQSLILGRSPLLADALFQQQMKYIAQQADFYKQETALRNQQREFDMVWQKRLLDQQGAQVAAQAKIVGYQGYIYSLQQQQFKLEQQKNLYDQKQAAIQQQYLGEQAGDLAAINLAIQQFLQGQGPVAGGTLQPEDLVQKMADQLKSGALSPQGLQQVIRGLGISPAEQGMLFQLVTQLSKQPETLAQMTRNMNNANDKQLVGLFQKLKDSGAFTIQVQQAGQQNAALQSGGTGSVWQTLATQTKQIADASSIIAKVLAPGTPFLQDISTIANILGPLAVGIGTLYNIIGLWITLRGGGFPSFGNTPGVGTGNLPGGGRGPVPGNAPGSPDYTDPATYEPTPRGVPGGGTIPFMGAGMYPDTQQIPTFTVQGMQDVQQIARTKQLFDIIFKGKEYMTTDAGKNFTLVDQNRDPIHLLRQLLGLDPRPQPVSAPDLFKQVLGLPTGVPGPVAGIGPVSPAQQLAIFQKYANNSNTSPSQAEMNQHLKGMEITMRGVQDNTAPLAKNQQTQINRQDVHTTWFSTLTKQQQAAYIKQEQQRLIAKNSDDTLSKSKTTQTQSLVTQQTMQQGQDKYFNHDSVNDIAAGFQKAWDSLAQGQDQFFTHDSSHSGGAPAGHPGFIAPHVNAEFHQKMNYGIHQGVDFAAAQGTPIGAFNMGRVANTGFYPWGGEVDVDIGHGLVERYLHLSQIGVQRGQMLLPRQRMGLTGGGTPASGLGYYSSGAHSHVQIDAGNINQGLDPWPIWAMTGVRDISAFYGSPDWASHKGGAGGRIPKYHDGGIAMRRQFAELGDGNEPEAVVPLSRLQQVLKSIGQPAQGRQDASSPSPSGAGARPAPAVSVAKLADTFEVHVHTSATKLDDQATDELADQVLAILNDALAKLTPSGRTL